MDNVLRITIDNNEPVELIQLTKSLYALDRQYKKYIADNGFLPIERDSKLYIKEIKSGSVIVELMDVVSAAVIPFAEYTNTIVGFTCYLKSAYDYYRGLTGNKPDLDISDKQDLRSIINVVKGNVGSVLTIENVNYTDSSQHNTINMTTNIVNGVSDQVKEDIELDKAKKDGPMYESVLMIFSQTRSDIDSKKGNKVIVDQIIEGKEMPVLFYSSDIKEKILGGDDNFYKYAYQVDITVKYIGEKIAAYMVTELKDQFLY